MRQIARECWGVVRRFWSLLLWYVRDFAPHPLRKPTPGSWYQRGNWRAFAVHALIGAPGMALSQSSGIIHNERWYVLAFLMRAGFAMARFAEHFPNKRGWVQGYRWVPPEMPEAGEIGFHWPDDKPVPPPALRPRVHVSDGSQYTTSSSNVAATADWTYTFPAA